MQPTKMLVRDVRKGSFRVDDAFIDSFAGILGPWAVLAYVSLCRHANKGQEAWPSYERMGEQMGRVSKPTVIKAIRALESHGIIGVIRSRDARERQAVNVYVLLDKSLWTVKPGRVNGVDPEPGKRGLPSRVNEPGKRRLLEGNKRKDTHLKEEKTSGIGSIRSTLDEVRRELESKGVLKRKS